MEDRRKIRPHEVDSRAESDSGTEKRRPGPYLEKRRPLHGPALHRMSRGPCLLGRFTEGSLDVFTTGPLSPDGETEVPKMWPLGALGAPLGAPSSIQFDPEHGKSSTLLGESGKKRSAGSTQRGLWTVRIQNRHEHLRDAMDFEVPAVRRRTYGLRLGQGHRTRCSSAHRHTHARLRVRGW